MPVSLAAHFIVLAYKQTTEKATVNRLTVQWQRKKTYEKMDSTLSSVVTRSSKSKHNNTPVHAGKHELNHDHNPDDNRNHTDTSVWWGSEKLEWFKRHRYFSYFRRNSGDRHDLRYSNTGRLVPTGNSNENCWRNRTDRRHQKHYNKCYYYFLIGILSIGFPSIVRAEDEVNNTSNPVAAATGNVTNQAVQFQNNGAASRQYFGPNVSCNGSTMTFSPFYMGNHTEPRTMTDEGRLVQESYTKGENWGAQINFMVPLDRESVRQCKRIAKRVEEKMRLDYELTRAIKCAEIMQKGFTLHPKSQMYVMCHDVVPISALQPKKPKKKFGLF